MTMSAADFLDQWFETAPLKATMSASGIIGTYQGVRSPGTAYVLLHHYMGEIDGAFRAWGIPRGGTGGVSEAIASSARSFGAEIRTEAPVARITVRNGRATGVVLESGEEIGAAAVLASTDAKVTFLDLLESGTLEPEFEESIRQFRFRGSSGKVNLALDGLARLHVPAGHRASTCGGPSASRPRSTTWSRHTTTPRPARFSRRPYIDMIIPTLVDPRMAPPGKHIVSCFVQYAPYRLAEGTWDDQREAFGDAVVDTHRGAGARTSGASSCIARCSRRSTSSARWASPRATSSRASCRSSSCSSIVPRPAGRASGRRSRTSGCAARRRTRAAASWAHPVASRRWSCCARRSGVAGVTRRRDRLGRHRHRRRPQRARVRRVPRPRRPAHPHPRATRRGGWRACDRPRSCLVPGSRSMPIPSVGCGARSPATWACRRMVCAWCSRRPGSPRCAPDGPPITLWGDRGAHRRRAGRASPRHDAAAWVGVDAEVRTLAGVLSRLMAITPPDPSAAVPRGRPGGTAAGDARPGPR